MLIVFRASNSRRLFPLGQKRANLCLLFDGKPVGFFGAFGVVTEIVL
jgi:hypothetical protein